jgi:hypothetical protein
MLARLACDAWSWRGGFGGLAGGEGGLDDDEGRVGNPELGVSLNCGSETMLEKCNKKT